MRLIYSIGWFSTGRDKAARELLEVVQQAINGGELRAKLAFVFSNREPGEDSESDLLFQQVKDYGLPLVCLSYKRFRSEWLQQGKEASKARVAYEREVMARIGPFTPGLCVLAGYMLIVGEEMCRRYPIINLHPAAPGGPVGNWQEVMWRLIETRASRSGAMMHLVTPELDRGPVVAYCTFSLRGRGFDELWDSLEGRPIEEVKALEEGTRLFDLLRQRELAREFPLLLSTLKAVSERETRIEDGRVLDSTGKPFQGLDLTEQVEALLSENRRSLRNRGV